MKTVSRECFVKPKRRTSFHLSRTVFSTISLCGRGRIVDRTYISRCGSVDTAAGLYGSAHILFFLLLFVPPFLILLSFFYRLTRTGS